MSDQETYENVPVTRNPLPNSVSEHHLARDNALSSRFGESLPIMNADNEQITQIGSNLSRFPDDFTNLNDDNLDNASPIIVSTTGSTGQTNSDKDQDPSVDTSSELEKLEQTKILGRWDGAWDEHEKQQQQEQQENNEIPPTNEQPNENIDIAPVNSTNPPPPSINITRVYVREFLPTSADDPTFSILRNLFVRSFDEFYNQIETQLNLKSEKTLIQWLDETFDEEQQEILSKKYRCFLLCGNENQDSQEIIIGFLTLREEEEGSIYIAQVAVRLDIKRRGYGAQLLQHLRNVYPPNTQYWGLCRRANRPALQFYLKQGAKFMENDEVATKYGYDPTFYAGFEFVDTVSVIGSHQPLGRSKPLIDQSDEQPTIITNATENDQNLSTTNDDQQTSDLPKKKPKNVVGCCNLL